MNISDVQLNTNIITILFGYDSGLIEYNILNILNNTLKYNKIIIKRIESSSISIKSAIEWLNESALFSNHNVLILENADKLLKSRAGKKSSAIALLKSFEQRKHPPATLILLTTSLSAREVRELGFGKSVSCRPLEDWPGNPELTRWTQDRAREFSGKTLDRDAVQALLTKTGNSGAAILNAVRILGLHAGERDRITAADVEALLGSEPSAHVFALAEAASRGDTGKALGILRHLLEAGEDPHAVLPALIHHYRRLAQALSEVAQGTAAPSCRGVQAVHPAFRAPFLAALARMDLGKGRRALGLLHQADRRLKGGKGLPAAALERLLLRLSGPVR